MRVIARTVMQKPGPFEEAQIMAKLVRHRFFLKGDKRGEPADLSFRNLSGLDISKQALINIVFRGASLAGANLSECDLTGADFFGADLEGADLHGAKLTGADFRGANLCKAILSHCHLQGSDFSASGKADSDIARLTDAKLDHAMLCQANLNGCDMSGAELVDADLSGADLSRAVLVGAELSGASLDNVKLNNTMLELSRLSVSQRNQMGSLEGIVERAYNPMPADAIQLALKKHADWIESGGEKGARIDFDGADISSVSFKGANISGARLRRCSLKGANLTGAVIDLADMTYSDLSYANLTEASIRGTTLRGANLSNADMTRAKVVVMPFQATKSWPTNLDRAILHYADLTNAIFEKAIMNYADLTGAILAGANFIEVDLTRVKKPQSNKSITSTECKRAAQRYSEPKLFVKTPYGVFPTANWSAAGICLSYNGEKSFSVDEVIAAKVVAEGKPPPHDATFTVVKDDRARGVALMKFTDSSEALITYLQSLIP